MASTQQGINVSQMTSKKRGFTIVEVAVVVVIIGILTTVGAIAFTAIQKQSRDSLREANMTILTEALEKYYQKNGEYPSCVTLSTNPQQALPDIGDTVYVAPRAGEGVTNSIVCSDLNAHDDEDSYAYLGDASSECISGSACVGFVIRYREEQNNVVKEKKSVHDSELAGVASNNGGGLDGRFNVGDIGPGGGIVFYDAGSRQSWGRYLEAAPRGWYGTGSDAAIWGCVGTSISGARGTSIGSGRANTAAILASCSESEIAARIAVNYRGGGLRDWFLPSVDELNELWLRRDLIGGFKTTPAYDVYLTSTESGASMVQHQRFSNGSKQNSNKGYVSYWYSSQHIHPIRAF